MHSANWRLERERGKEMTYVAFPDETDKEGGRVF